MEKIFDAKGEIIVSGVHPSVGNSQIPLWQKGSNILFKDGSAKVGPQQSPLYTKPSALVGNGIRSIDNEGVPALVWGDRRDLWKGTDPPTAINVTGAVTSINDMDAEAANWTPTACSLSDDGATFAPGSSSSVRADSDGAAKFMLLDQDFAAAPHDFSDLIFSFWVAVDTPTWNNLKAGTAIHLKLGTDSGGASNWGKWYLPKSFIVLPDTWYRVELDTNRVPDAESGTVDLADISYIEFTVDGESTMSVNDTAWFDSIGIGGRYTGGDLDRWSIVQFGQSVLATNGVDPVQYLADISTGVFADINSAGGDLSSSFRCKILQKLGPYIIAFNTDNDNTEARWCTEDDVLTWTPVASNSARDINLRDMNSSIKAVTEFGNSLMVIGHNRAHIFQFLGPPFFFGAQKLIDGIGAVSSNAVTEGGRLIFGFGPNGIWLTDGQIKEYIDEPDIHSFIYEGDNKYDALRAALTCTWYDARDDEVYFSYPTVDGFGFTVSFNPSLQVWAMHDYWRTAAGAGELWDAPGLLDSNGNVWIQSETGTGSSFEFSPIGVGDILGITLGWGEGGYGEQGYSGIGEFD
jgi:hypothetical protein